MDEQARRLLELVDTAQQCGRLSPELARWLQGGLDAYLREGIPLDDALGIKPDHGQRSIAYRYRKQRRDHYLREAWSACRGAEPWDKTKTLQTEIHRFESIIWPRWRDREHPPADASILRGALFRARRIIGGQLPSSARQLHRICT